jgi:hypothetical protein
MDSNSAESDLIFSEFNTFFGCMLWPSNNFLISFLVKLRRLKNYQCWWIITAYENKYEQLFVSITIKGRSRVNKKRE